MCVCVCVCSEGTHTHTHTHTQTHTQNTRTHTHMCEQTAQASAREQMEQRLQQALYLVEQAEKENEELRAATQGVTHTNELLRHEVPVSKET